MLVLGYLNSKERVLKDEKMQNDMSDIKKVLGSLSQGVALTVNFKELSQKVAEVAEPTQSVKIAQKEIQVDDLEENTSRTVQTGAISRNSDIQ